MPAIRNENRQRTSKARPSAECPKCGQELSRMADLPRHMVLHNKNKKLISCDYKGCNFKTLQLSNLATHVRSVHTFEKPYVCVDDPDNCEYKTSDPAAFTRHRKVKHGYKPKARTARSQPKPFTSRKLSSSYTSSSSSSETSSVSAQSLYDSSDSDSTPPSTPYSSSSTSGPRSTSPNSDSSSDSDVSMFFSELAETLTKGAAHIPKQNSEASRNVRLMTWASQDGESQSLLRLPTNEDELEQISKQDNLATDDTLMDELVPLPETQTWESISEFSETLTSWFAELIEGADKAIPSVEDISFYYAGYAGGCSMPEASFEGVKVEARAPTDMGFDLFGDCGSSDAAFVCDDQNMFDAPVQPLFSEDSHFSSSSKHHQLVSMPESLIDPYCLDFLTILDPSSSVLNSDNINWLNDADSMMSLLEQPDFAIHVPNLEGSSLELEAVMLDDANGNSLGDSQTPHLS